MRRVESPRVGRRRATGLHLPAGVREIAGRWYWQPTKAWERAERRAKGLSASEPLGKADSLEARKKWAELTGLRDPAIQEGTVGELLALFFAETVEKRPTGKRRADTTIARYRYCRAAIEAKFGAARYGRTEFEASRGQAIGTAEIQRFIDESGSYGRQRLAVLKNAFDYGIRRGRTTYNPCDKAIAPACNARGREPLEWELEALCALASPVVALILEYKATAGYRISEVLRVHRRDMTAEGIRHQVKGGRWETLLWSPTLRRIVADAERLPRASRFPASPLFPSSRRRAYSYSGFDTAWQELKRATNEALAGAGVLDPDTLELHPGLSIDDLHIHDMRSKVHDDAEAMGREGHEAIGNTERVADRHYARRERRRRPLR